MNTVYPSTNLYLLQFYLQCLIIFLVKFIPRYFIFLKQLWIGFFLYFHFCWFIVDITNKTAFRIFICILLLFLNSFISSSSFLNKSFGSPYTVSYYLQIMTVFPIWKPLISFSYMIVVTRISSTSLNKSGESGHPWPVLDLQGKAFSFCLLSMMLSVGFHM